MAHRRFWLPAVIGTFSLSLPQWVGRIADSQLLYKSPIEANRPSKPRSASNTEKSFRSQLWFIIPVGPCVIILYAFVGVKTQCLHLRPYFDHCYLQNLIRLAEVEHLNHGEYHQSINQSINQLYLTRVTLDNTSTE